MVQEENQVYVIYHSSDSFAEVTGVSMVSLFENNKQMDRIQVLYIERGMSDENKMKLQSIAEKYNREISFMEMPNWSEKLNIELKSSKAGWLGFGYNRLFLTEFIPDNVDRVLYLDSDTVIEDSLDELWNTKIDDYYLAAVDDCLSSKYRDIVGLSSDGVYCNAGMLLINLKKWREENITPQFIKIIHKNNGFFVFNEQSIINSLFAGKIKVLPQKYNVNSLIYLFEYDELMRLRKPYLFSYSKEELNSAKKNPVITHYTGNFYVYRRPWIENSDHPHKEAYLKYRALSPWGNCALRKDNRSVETKIYAYACHLLPRSMMIGLVSCLYNVIRPLFLKKKMKKTRDK